RRSVTSCLSRLASGDFGRKILLTLQCLLDTRQFNDGDIPLDLIQACLYFLLGFSAVGNRPVGAVEESAQLHFLRGGGTSSAFSARFAPRIANSRHSSRSRFR